MNDNMIKAYRATESLDINQRYDRLLTERFGNIPHSLISRECKKEALNKLIDEVFMSKALPLAVPALCSALNVIVDRVKSGDEVVINAIGVIKSFIGRS